MRKKPILILLAVVLVLTGIILFTRPRSTINLDHFSLFLLSSSLYYDQMEPLEAAAITERYPDITPDMIKDSRVFASTDDTAREFAIIQASSAEAADRIQVSLALYSHDLLDKYESANPVEWQRVRGYVIRRTRNYVIFSISDSISSGQQIIQSYLESINYDNKR